MTDAYFGVQFSRIIGLGLGIATVFGRLVIMHNIFFSTVYNSVVIQTALVES